MNEPVLYLSDRKPFGRGANRLCFVHPGDNNVCIKVMRPGKDAKGKRGRLFLPVLPVNWYDANLREFNECRRLAGIGDESIWRHVSCHYGFINTDLGVGVMTQLIRNADGTIARPLSEMICRGGGIPYAALEEFCVFLRRGHLWNWRDPQPQNVVCAHLTEGERLVIVDGLAQKKLIFQIIPKRSHKLDGRFPSYRRKKRAAQYARAFERRVFDMF